MKKIAVYSCISAGYDSIQQPCSAPSDFSFILFVPKGCRKKDREGAWQIQELPVDWDNPIILSRFPKMCPHSLLEDYDYSLWLDGNVGIAGDGIFEKCREMASRGVRYAGIRHPERDCVYEECDKVLKCNREKLGRLLHIVGFLSRNGLARHSGLMENNVIFRKHNSPDVIEFDRLWWEMFLAHSPRRDQLVHTMCLSAVPSLEIEYLLPEGVSVRNSPDFNYVGHPAPELTWIRKKLNGPERLILKKYTEFLLKRNMAR